MIEFRLGAEFLGNTRFAFSPLAEAASSIRLLGEPHLAHLHQPWLREVRGNLRGLPMEMLCAVLPPGRWAPDFMYQPAQSPDTTIEQQLHDLAQTPVEDVRDQLTQVWEGRSVPAAASPVLRDDLGPGRLAEAVWSYWQVAVEPHWTRMCGVLEEDVSYRASRSLVGGLFDLLTDIHPEMSIQGDYLYVDKPHHDDESHDAASLTLIPSVFVWPRLILSHSTPTSFELTYGARGVGRVWEGIRDLSEDDDVDGLAALMGRARSTILKRLTVPASTTQLARELGQSPSTVSQHLSVLRAGGLVTAWRSGRLVLYRRTPLGTSVIAAGSHHEGRRSGT